MPARILASLGAVLALSACTSFYDIAIQTPIQPKLDVSRFQRVLIAGFATGGTNEIATNLETVRLLRSQLRSRSQLQVLDTEALALNEIALERTAASDADWKGRSQHPNGGRTNHQPQGGVESEAELERLEHIFANVTFWKQLGEEYQHPLIITGTVLFAPHQRSGIVTQEREEYDSFGRRQVVSVRTYRDREGYVLSPKFIFIDGHTGATLHTERHREEILYDSSQNLPALLSYFQLMERLLPSFVGVFNQQSVRGNRILIK